MADQTKFQCPPYATFSAFINFINKLRDTTVPSRIDPSVFGNASGSISYSIIAALKVLKLIGADGVPTRTFIDLVNEDEEHRKPLLRAAMAQAYPSLMDGSFDITNGTAGQFDEHIRDRYEAKGSTIDKVASFFIAAANYTDLPLSQLIKDRKPLSPSASSGKSRKQRKQADDPFASLPQVSLTPPVTEKALEYKLVDLMSEALDDSEVMQAIIKVVTFLKTREAAKQKKTATDQA